MKAILLILVVAVGLAAAHYQQSASKSQAALEKAVKAYETLKEQIDALRTEHAEAIARATDLDAQVATLQKQIADAQAKAAIQTEAEKQLARDQALQVYNRHKAQIDEQRAAMTEKLTAMRAEMKTKQGNSPRFTEQGTTFRDGVRFSSGVRMSQADRDRILKKYEGEVAALAAQIGVAEGEMVRIDSRAQELETGYAAALARLQ